MSPSPYAELRETHSAVVLLVGERAYKLKKPVDLGFLDFSTRERRREVCLREVELNRRLAPDVYLGVADVVGPGGEVEDHLVEMVRMPEDRRLATLVRRGADVEDGVRALARLMVDFHARCARSPAIAAAGSVEALGSRWHDNIAVVRQHAGAVVAAGLVDEAEALVEQYLAGRRPLLDLRRDTGAVLDGHGDLLADDIFCLDDGPRVLDCIEFDDALRHLDRLDDVAFLAMDLEHLGAGGLAGRLLSWYAELGGDHAPPSLVHHYVAYRAFVRAKVACLRHAQGDPGSAAAARELVGLALDHLRAARPVLVLVGGPPGTGKSTLAGALADRHGLVVLGSDRLRKELAGLDPHRPAAEAVDVGLYTEERGRAVYAELTRRAETLLGLGESVVLDATWPSALLRDLAGDAARRAAADVVALRCACPLDVVLERLPGRRAPSDAGPEVARALAARFEGWPEAAVVDTGRPVATCRDEASAHVRPDPAGPVSERRPGRRPAMVPD